MITFTFKALLNAWRDACQWKGEAQLYIPPGNYMVGPVMFEGPCKGSVTFMNRGALKAPENPAMITGEQWITFQYIDRFTLSGGGSGTFDGQGAKAWSMSKCASQSNCTPLPIVCF